MSQTSIWTPHLTLMDQAKVEKLHTAAVEILETTGLNVHHPTMRIKLAEAGARLGADTRVYLSRTMIDLALQTAKRDIVVYNRLGEPAMALGPNQIYFGTGSDLVFTRDLEMGTRRASTLEDVGRAARLCDAFSEIDFVMSFALPADVPNEDRETRQYYLILQNTVKPPIMTSFSGIDTLERMHEMACLVAGGEAAFRTRPNYILYGQFVSPLQHDRNAIERLIFCADHLVPLIYIPTIIPGASGPITLAGSLALAAAECLAGLVMHQIQRPGSPFIFGTCVSPMDMRTMLFPYGSPEWRLNDLAMAEMARSYGLPVFGTGGATDSKLLDAQAGMEFANSLLIAAMAGTNLIHDVGYLDTGLTGSLESLVLGAEQIRWVKKFIAGLDVSEETLALDVIRAVGPARHFLAQGHTRRHLRKTLWQPYALDHRAYEAWTGSGSKDYATRGRELARQLLHSHQPPAVPDAIQPRLRELCRLPV